MADVYLVTGATGSIGSAIARYLYRQGEAVRVFVRSEWKFRNFFPEETSAELERKIEIIVGDILQREQIEPAMQDVSAIFHCTNFPLTIFERNITATQNILELALEQGAHVIYPSNVWVYGKPQSVPITEEHPKYPCSRLGELKLRIDEMCMEYFHKGQLPVTILHLPDFYGPYVLNSWMKANYEAAQRGKSMNMIGNIHKQHELIYIDEAARALCSIANLEETFGQYYNVPGYGGITLHSFLTYLYEAAGTTGSIRTIPPWLLPVMGLFNKEIQALLEMQYLFEEEILLDGSKIKDVIGYVPGIDYRMGTQRTMYWYQKTKTETSSLSL
jgi:nucleoside-diphosphate-sugar epimerase